MNTLELAAVVQDRRVRKGVEPEAGKVWVSVLLGLHVNHIVLPRPIADDTLRGFVAVVTSIKDKASVELVIRTWPAKGESNLSRLAVH